MSKLVKIAVVLALLVFILIPGVTGFLVESSIEKAESGYGQALNSGPFQLLDNNFDRGWFSSDQTVELKLKEPEIAAILHAIGGHNDNSQLPSLLVDTKATHGVIPLASPTQGGLRPAIAQTASSLSLKYSDGTLVPLPVKVYSSLGTGKWARVVADPISNPDLGANVNVSWDGADLSANFGNTTSYEGELGAFKLVRDGSAIETTPLSIEGNVTKTRYSFTESESSLSLKKVTITPATAANNSPIEINNISGNGGLNLENDRAIVSSRMSVGRVDNAPVDIDGIEMDVNYVLDAEAFSTFITESRKLRADKQGEEVDAEVMMAAMSQMLAKGVSFELNKLDVAVGGGTLSMNLDLNIPEGSGSPQAAMANGEASGNVVIPDSVVEALSTISPELAGGLTMGAMMGFVEQRDGAYQARVSYKNGVLLLNDLPVPLPF